MKKILLIAIIAIFTTGAFAANGTKVGKSKTLVQNTNSKNKALKLSSKVNTQKSKVFIDCYDNFSWYSTCGVQLVYKRKCFDNDSAMVDYLWSFEMAMCGEDWV